MARKSRKNIGTAVTDITSTAVAHISDNAFTYENRIPTAIYARLSKEDNGYGKINDSHSTFTNTHDSINTQVRLVKDFVRTKPNLYVTDTFIDNGFTGTNFDRPQFMAMMEKIMHGEIGCVVVKDLSRFGRNYVELGYYIETLFPRLNVRLISVNDNFDSMRLSDRNSISVPVKNMINDAYAKDISKKQGAITELKKKMGIHSMTIAPYGYMLGENRNLIPDPRTSLNVRMIFSWAISGVSRSSIAKRLNCMNISTPLGVLHSQGKMLKKTDNGWTRDIIKSILGNPVYAGTLAMGKSKQSLYNSIEPTKYAREDWTYFYDRHEPIVSRDEYNIIEEQIKANKHKIEERKRKAAEKNIPEYFSDMVYCAECGKRMSFYRDTHEKLGYYHCDTDKNSSQCPSGRIQQNLLKIIVGEQTEQMIRLTIDNKELLKKIRRDEIPQNRLRYYKRLIQTKRRDAAEYKDKLTLLYADFSDGLYRGKRQHQSGENNPVLYRSCG